MLVGLRTGIVIAVALQLAGCRSQGMLDVVDSSMAKVRCADGVVGAPPPPENINVDHVPVPFPVMPDPRSPMSGAERWELDLSSALAVAIGNSEVVRALPGATTSLSGSTLGGTGGDGSLRGGFGAGGQNAMSSGSSSGSGGSSSGSSFGGSSAVGGGAGGGAAAGVSSGRFATVYDPAIAAAQVETALGAFDASLAASMFWERLENPPGQSFGGFVTTRPALDTAYWRSSITKPFITGTVAAVRFNNNYFFVPPPDVPPTVNPQYQSNLEFAVLQPLLRGAGSQVGRMPILIAGAQANQSAWEFKRRMMAMIRSVETAYWQLYSSQVNLRAIEDALPLYGEVVRVEESRLRANAAVPADVAQAQADFLDLRGQRLQALSDVATKQALLRNLLGLPPTDGRQIVLREPPTRAPLVIDWEQTIAQALDRRPDVIRQRLAVHVREMQLVIAKNGLLPQVNGEGLYRLNGLGEDLGRSIDVLTENRFQDWRLGVSLEVPLGNHVARGQMRAAQMQLLREQALLKQTAHIATHQLADVVRDIDWLYQQYEVAERRQTANGEWQRGARARFVTPAGGISLLQALDIYLRSIRSAVTANQNAAALLSQYNIALARLEEAKGTILASHNIFIYNDPCTAVQHTTFGGCKPGQDLIDAGAVPTEAQPEGTPTPPTLSGMPHPASTLRPSDVAVAAPAMAAPVGAPMYTAPPISGGPMSSMPSSVPQNTSSLPPAGSQPRMTLEARDLPRHFAPESPARRPLYNELRMAPAAPVAMAPASSVMPTATVTTNPAAYAPSTARITGGTGSADAKVMERAASSTTAAGEQATGDADAASEQPSSRRNPLRFRETAGPASSVDMKVRPSTAGSDTPTLRQTLGSEEPLKMGQPVDAGEQPSGTRLKVDASADASAPQGNLRWAANP